MSLWQEVPLSGKSDAKGRNGYYKIAKVQVWETSTDGTVYIDILSKRGGASARMALTPQDYVVLRDFFKSL